MSVGSEKKDELASFVSSSSIPRRRRAPCDPSSSVSKLRSFRSFGGMLKALLRLCRCQRSSFWDDLVDVELTSSLPSLPLSSPLAHAFPRLS